MLPVRFGDGMTQRMRGRAGETSDERSRLAGPRYGLTVLLLALISSSARAESPPPEPPRNETRVETTLDQERETLFLRYDAPAECPAGDSFRKRVEGLTALAHFSGNPESAARELSITIAGASGRYVGELRLSDQKTVAKRSFEDTDCSWVLDALALATALALDPNVLEEEQEASEVPQGSPPLPPEVEEQEQEREPESGPKKYSFELFLKADLAFLAADSSELSTGVESSGRLLRPGAEVGAAYFIHAKRVSVSFEASAGWAGAFPEVAHLHFVPLVRGSVCPLWLPFGQWFRLSPCAGVQGAMLLSRGVELNPPFPTAGRPFVAGEALVRGQFMWERRSMWDRLRLGLRGGVLVPVSEIEYRVVGQDGTNQAVLSLTRRVAPTFGVDLSWAVF